MQQPLTCPPSGKQFHISAAGYCAVIVEVGAGIRRLERNGRPLLASYEEDVICDGAHGAHLIPWPNRVLGGHYTFMGQRYQLPLTEPEANNAIHGLLRWEPFDVVALTQRAVTLATTLHPTPGYPFTLGVCLHHELSERGLTVITEVINQGNDPCPVAVGHHPYLSPALGEKIDSALFSASALVFDDTTPPTLASTSLGTPQPIGAQILDTTFAARPSSTTNQSWARLTGADGRTVELWADDSYRYLQLFTGDTLASHRRRRAIAVEPMTAPPNAFQSGQDLLVLQPGQTLETRWGVQLL